MRVLFLLLLSFPAFGQLKEGEGPEQIEARQKLIYIYKRADVSMACQRNPEATLTLTLPPAAPDGKPRELQILCKVRARYLASIGQL